MSTTSKSKTMTEGPLAKQILLVSLPLALSNLLQILFNMSDVAVVGRFAGSTALGSVGSTATFVTLFTGFLIGLSNGVNVLVARFYGAGHPKDVSKTVHSALLVSLAAGVLLLFVGLFGSPALLELLNTKEDLLPGAILYLRVYFLGMPALALYNFGNAIFSAIGDTKKPLMYLSIAGALNIALNLFFVIVFHMGVEGVAYATIIAQAVSAILTMIVLMRYDGSIRLELRKLRFHWDMLKKIVSVGIPAALQMAITAFSNVFVQGYINHFGADCMSGWTAYTKIDQLVILPVQSLSMASTTFVGQNLGVGNVARAKGGVRRALLLSFAVTAVLLVPVLLLAPGLTSFFNSKAEVVSYGALLLRLLSPFYFFFCINQVYSGALRGAGNSRMPMFIMLGSFVVFRQIYLYVMANCISNEIVPIALSYPAGWFVCSAATLLYYTHCKFDHYRLVEDV